MLGLNKIWKNGDKLTLFVCHYCCEWHRFGICIHCVESQRKVYKRFMIFSTIRSMKDLCWLDFLVLNLNQLSIVGNLHWNKELGKLLVFKLTSVNFRANTLARIIVSFLLCHFVGILFYFTLTLKYAVNPEM